MSRPVGFTCAALLAAAAAGAPAAAQPAATEYACRDDRWIDRCAPAEHRRMLDLFGLLPVEDHVEAGSQLRRVIYVDGYGRDVVAIVFIRPRAAEPLVRIHFPRRADGSRIAPLEASVPPRLWEDILVRSDRFERELATARAPAPAQDGAFLLCLHAWVFAVETVEPGRGGAQPRVRRQTQNACEDGPAEGFAREVETAAIALFPECQLLDPGLHRNDAARLGACAMLTGDRRTAALVHNAGLRLAFDDAGEEAAHLFDPNATLDRHGEAIAGRAAAEGWRELLAGPPAAFLFLTGVHGESASRARLDGFLLRYGDEDDDANARSRATVTMTWRDGGRGDFQIESVHVGAFLPVPPRVASAD